MDANITRFEAMTVKALREIAKLMGFKGYSKLRKAELVDMLAAQVVYAEFQARKENEAMHTATVSHFDFPVPDGRTVTEAHVKICAERGHGYYFKEDIHQGYCPRCGVSTMIDKEGNLTAVVVDGAPATVVPQKEVAPHEQFDSFLTELHTTLKALAIKAEACETAAYRADMFGDSNLAEQWTTVAKDLNTALGNVMWSQSYRAETSI